MVCLTPYSSLGIALPYPLFIAFKLSHHPGVTCYVVILGQGLVSHPFGASERGNKPRRYLLCHNSGAGFGLITHLAQVRKGTNGEEENALVSR